MNENNIFILSAGRRVELVQCFQSAARRLKIKSNIIAGDCSDTAPAIYFADKKCILPRISEPNYIDSIIDVCGKEKVSLIVPTIDTDLLLLSEQKEYIESKTNAIVLISRPEVVEICRDKIKTQEFLVSKGFHTPKTYKHDELEQGNIIFPLFIKPKSGSSSINAFKVNNKQELKFYMNIIEDPIVQDFIEGEEYTVDVFLDFESNILTIVPRLRIATRSGEISKGKIVKDREIIDNIKLLMEELKPIGHITVQLMKTKKGIEYIEINPRFGGGAPMSIRSGADSCEYIYRIIMGEKLEYNENYRDDIIFLRFDNSICLDENMELIR
jgi:carbamoyl-phosphate synthase large subunit